jgi:RNA polymerase sigma-70 factor (ECF subfamily)
VRSADLRVEVEQRVRDLLIVGTAARPPRIGNYSGQGPLAKWAVVVAQRQVVTVLRGNEVEQRARDGAAVEVALHPAGIPEVAYAKQRYREAFEESLRLALPALAARDRMLLRLHLVSGTSTESIGKMYGVSQPTASRWVARAREALSGELQRLLRERLRLSPDEVASLAGVVASQIDASVSRLLRAP